ncbi:D(2) dopamine receptor-like [Dreissena polymorpha]|uniref:D(2) dopamine receptor-like n=1 Tax=Dreissena polymorpha TaxID=45954 RepID=UPI002264C7A2|nr:D(2) dopamine receptor-like [Dreissena polymorpha]
MPITFYTIIMGRWEFSHSACVVFRFLSMITLVTSVMSLCNISINRYVIVCYPQKFKHIYTVRNVIVMIIGVNHMSYAFFMIGCCFGIPFTVISVCNVFILRTVRASRLRVKPPPDPQQSAASIKTSINRLTIGIKSEQLSTEHHRVTFKNSEPLETSSTISSTEFRMTSKNVLNKDGQFTTTLHTPSYQSPNSTLTRQQSSRFLHPDWKPASENTPQGRGLPVPAISIHPSSDALLALPSNSETELNAQGPVYDKQMSKPTGQQTQPLRRREEIRLAFSLIIVVVVFVICWLPYCISMLLSIFYSGHVPREFHMFTLIIGYSNSCCNPFIYGVMNKRFKDGFKRILIFWQYRNSSDQNFS